MEGGGGESAPEPQLPLSLRGAFLVGFLEPVKELSLRRVVRPAPAVELDAGVGTEPHAGRVGCLARATASPCRAERPRGAAVEPGVWRTAPFSRVLASGHHAASAAHANLLKNLITQTTHTINIFNSLHI